MAFVSIIGQRRLAWIGARKGQSGEVVRVAGQNHVIIRWDVDGAETWYNRSDIMIPPAS